MHDSDLAELEAKVADHDDRIDDLRFLLDLEIKSNRSYRDAEFHRRAANIKREIASTRPRDGGVANREPKRHRRGVPRLGSFGWLRSMASDDPATEDLLRRNTEAFDRLAKSTDRQAEILDRQAERLDRATETLDHAKRTLDRVVESTDRHARTLDRHSKAIRDQVAELQKFGETLDERTGALMDSFAFLAKDVRESGKA